MAAVINLSIVSDSELFRSALACRLLMEEGIELLGAAGTVRDLLQGGLVERTQVVLVHSALDPSDGAEITWELKRLAPSARVVVAGCRAGESDAVRAVEAGASACLENGAAYDVLVDAIRAASRGRATGASLELLVEIGRRIEALSEMQEPAAEARQDLSRRETEVARLVALGLGNKQIARRLRIRLSTVKNHVHNILSKLQIERRRELAGRV
jgi:DNA-binding NarL/FixJ family response regulator